MSNTLLHPKAEAPCLALRPREAAKALGVSERTLWTWTREGTIPHLKRGQTVLYPTDALRRWLDEQAQTNTTKGGAYDPR